MIHQPSGGAQGQATEIQIAAEHILKTRERLNRILAENTGQPLEVISRETDRDNFMSAEEAKHLDNRWSNYKNDREQICSYSLMRCRIIGKK